MFNINPFSMASRVFDGFTGAIDKNAIEVGAITNSFIAAKTSLGKDYQNKNINDLTTKQRDVINTRVSTIVAAVDRITLDGKGKNRSQEDVVKDVNKLAKEFGVEPLDISKLRGKNIQVQIGKKISEIEVIRTSPYQKGSERARENAAVVADNVSKYGSDYWSNLEKENQEKRDNFVGPTQTVPGRPNVIGQDYGIGAGTSVVGGTFTGGDDSAPGGNAGSTGNTGQDTYGGGFSQDDWNKGGLLGKKKTPKPKKMKRGGLASR